MHCNIPSSFSSDWFTAANAQAVLANSFASAVHPSGGVPQEKGINRDNNPRFKLKKQILRGWQGHQDEKTEEKLAKTDKNSETPKENLGSLNHPSFLRHQDE